MKFSNFIILALFCLSCAKSLAPDFTYYEANGGENIQRDINNLSLDKNGDPNIDEYHRINPRNFLMTDFQKPVNDYHIKSSRTGKVYECRFDEGDVVIIPIKENSTK